MWGKGVEEELFFGGVFGDPFWDPAWVPKWVKNLLIFGFNFRLFFWGFWSSLGASWEPSWTSWGSLGRPQEWKNADSPTRKPLFYKCSFLAFWSSWWPSWAHLGPSWADMIPKWAPKWTPKGVQKVNQKMIQKMTKNGNSIIHTITHLILKNRSDRKCSGPKWSKKLLTSKMFPRWLQDCPR